MRYPIAEQRNAVAVDLTPGPRRSLLLRRLAAAGIDPVTVEVGDEYADGCRVVVTSHPPALGDSPGVVVHLPDDGQPPAARLVSGQWLRLNGLDEIVEFVREIALEDVVELDD